MYRYIFQLYLLILDGFKISKGNVTNQIILGQGCIMHLAVFIIFFSFLILELYWATTLLKGWQLTLAISYVYNN